MNKFTHIPSPNIKFPKTFVTSDPIEDPIAYQDECILDAMAFFDDPDRNGLRGYMLDIRQILMENSLRSIMSEEDESYFKHIVDEALSNDLHNDWPTTCSQSSLHDGLDQ